MNHEERYICTEDADTLVMFIHGIHGTPGQFEALEAEALRQGCAVLNLMLPGHGAQAEAFGRSGRRAWLDHAQARLEEVRGRYRRVLVVGHSMGSLIALELARRFPGGISGIFAMATPLRVHFDARGLWRNIRALSQRKPEAQPKSQNALRRAARYLSWMPRYFDLIVLMALGRRRISRSATPVQPVHGLHDELVSRRAVGVFQRALGSLALEPVLLSHSSHSHYPREDEAALERSLGAFIQSMAHRKLRGSEP